MQWSRLMGACRAAYREKPSSGHVAGAGRVREAAATVPASVLSWAARLATRGHRVMMRMMTGCERPSLALLGKLHPVLGC